MKKVHIDELYITAFGCLSGFCLNLSLPLTSIEHENGWGKTTFAAFIKAMFYGLMDDTRKKNVLGERQRYKPWQGGVFGGYMVFSVSDSGNKRTYRVERTFGEKKKADTFALFDSETNTPSHDYGERLGDELFGVNADTAERSMFVTLEWDKRPVKSDDIAAKLTGIVQNDDMASYSNAIDLLDDAASDLLSARRCAIIPRLEKQIADDEASLRAIAEDEKRLEDVRKSIETAEARRRELLEEQSQIQKECAMQVYYAKKSQRDAIKNALAVKEAKEKELRLFFGGDAPSNEKMQEIEGALEEYNKQKAIAERLEAQARQAGGAAGGAEEERAALSDKYRGVTVEEIDTEVRLVEKSINLGERVLLLDEEVKTALSEIGAKRAQRKHSAIVSGVLIACAAIFAVSSIAFVLRGSPWIVWMGAAAFSLGSGIGGIMVRSRPINTEAEDKRLRQAQKEKEAAKKEKERSEKASDEFIARFMPLSRYEDKGRGSAVSAIKREYSRLIALNAISEAYDTRDEMMDRVRKHLRGYATDKNSSIEEQVKECRYAIDALKMTSLDKDSAKSSLDDFDKAHKDEMNEILNAKEGSASLEQLDALNKEAARKIGEIARQAALLKTEEAALAANIDTRTARLESMEAGQRELKKSKDRYDVLCKAKSFLISAGEALQHKYMDAVTAGFNKYAKMAGSALPLNITSNLDVTVTSNGLTHSADYLSSGYKDLVNVCARLSLLDALFPDAAPPVIMDDPFVNLDGEKVQSALDMLRAITQDRQVIYLVCHKSRGVDSDKHLSLCTKMLAAL